MRALRDALDELPGAAFADLLESPDAFLLVVDVPGATADRTSVEARGQRLHVTVDRRLDDHGDFEVREAGRERELTWELPLPPDVDASAATAAVDRGVLELELPRTGGDATIPIE
jgi:HSP20 family molecular chaperone IbpA